VLVLHVLGQCLIRTAVTTITPRADMCFALASYLTRERGNRVPRRVLETLFWPEMGAAPASHSLSELIHKLRRKGVPIERDGAACIWLPRDAASVDVEALGTEPLATIAERDLAILPGYAPRTSAAFNDWVDDWRGHLQLRVLDDVVAAIPRAAERRDWPTTLALADQALRIDAENDRALVARAQAAEQLSRIKRGIDPQPDTGTGQIREAAPRQIWQARQSVSLADSDTALVGRERQMELLRDQATRTLRAEVRATYISGAAGVGKSRLVRELGSWMQANRAAVCTVSCGRHDSHRPLSVFIQAVPRLQAISGAAGCAPTTIACLARITQLATNASEMSERDDSLNLSASIRAAVIDLIDAVADEQPLLLAVEDVHWIDSASWSLLRTIAATAQHSVLVVCTSRTRWQHTAWGEPDTFVVEEVSPLDPTAARAHLTDCLARAQRDADERFLEWCVDTAGGNPYFIEELVNFWIATGEQYTAPPSLVALTEARLACLRPDALRVIQAAAILGKNSTLELLKQVLEFPTHLLFSAIEELAEAGLLTSTVLPDESRVAPVICRHDLIIRAATRALSPQGRTLLHHASARALEPIALASHSAELLWDCADHWQAAGQTDRSINAAVTCARHLHDMGLVHDAIARCKAALAMCRTDSCRAAVLRASAQAHYAARDWRAVSETVNQIRALEQVTGSQAHIHDDLELCELNAQRGLHRDWKGALERTLVCVNCEDADASHRVQAAINALKLATNIGDLKTMDLVYDEISPLSLRPGVRIEDHLTLTMIYDTIRGEGTTSANAARQLLRFAHRTLPSRYRLTVMLNCATALRRGGAPGESEIICEDLFHASVSLHAFDLASEACGQLIEMLADAGQMEGAAEWVTKYRHLRRPKSELGMQRSLRSAIARVEVWRGQWNTADELLGSLTGCVLWEDRVTMLRSAALATKVRLEVGRDAGDSEIADLVARLVPLNVALRTVGAQDYECFSLYLGYRYLNDADAAVQLLIGYTNGDRRDKRPLSPEIAAELAALATTPGRRAAAAELPECAGAIGAKNT
jgi:hypothetical protein